MCDGECFSCSFSDCILDGYNKQEGKAQNAYDLDLMPKSIYDKYNHREYAIKNRRDYEKTDKAKERRKKYNASEKGKERWRAYYKRKQERIALEKVAELKAKKEKRKAYDHERYMRRKMEVIQNASTII